MLCYFTQYGFTFWLICVCSVFFSADILQQDKHFLELIVVLVMIISIMCVEYLDSVCLLCV